MGNFWHFLNYIAIPVSAITSIVSAILLFRRDRRESRATHSEHERKLIKFQGNISRRAIKLIHESLQPIWKIHLETNDEKRKHAQLELILNDPGLFKDIRECCYELSACETYRRGMYRVQHIRLALMPIAIILCVAAVGNLAIRLLDKSAGYSCLDWIILLLLFESIVVYVALSVYWIIQNKKIKPRLHIESESSDV
ncbi:MAG: hypothetical protein OXI96_07985 [Acidimicrobiaceae bacterium]|nr:hypothetical protein [Acidimicrobiaceae bacterium]